MDCRCRVPLEGAELEAHLQAQAPPVDAATDFAASGRSPTT